MWRLMAVLLAGSTVAGCQGTGTPTTPSSATPVVKHAQYPTSFTVVGATISGVVSEVTPGGAKPLEGVSVYCDQCGEQGHTLTTTDANGHYNFSGDIAAGGGIWISPGYTTYLIVSKDGYQDPPGLPRSTWPGNAPAGWREVTVAGDTRFDVQLVAR